MNEFLEKWEALYGTEKQGRALEERFSYVIEQAYRQTGHRVVILIDEYDKPLLQNLHDEDMQDQLRNMLKPFYGVLKTMDGAIRFALLTGVTKFGKVSVFSDLNTSWTYRWTIVTWRYVASRRKRYSTCLEDEVRELAGAQDMTYEETCLRLKECYDGYHFVENSIGMYNPFSLLNTFRSLEFGSLLVRDRHPHLPCETAEGKQLLPARPHEQGVTAETFNHVDFLIETPLTIIYQSGYLTIKGYDEEFNTYQLGFPNKEVAEGFIKYLVPYYMPELSRKPYYTLEKSL